MAQITIGMCELIMAAADRGDRHPLTVWELKQLAYLAKKQLLDQRAKWEHPGSLTEGP